MSVGILVALAGLGSGFQDLSCVRACALNESEKYRCQVAMTTPAGDIELRCDLTTRVKGVSAPNADLEYRIENFQTLFNGTVVKSEAQKPPMTNWTVKMGPNGLPVKPSGFPKAGGYLLQVFQVAMMACALPGTPGKLGSTYACEWQNPSDKVEFQGKSLLADLKNGALRVTSDVSMKSAGQTTNFKTTAWMKQPGCQATKIEGLSENPHGPEGVGLKSLKFLIEAVN